MKKLLSIIILALLLTFAVSAETLSSTKIRGTCSDPWLFTHNDCFYLARTGASRVAVHKASTLSGLAPSKTESSIAYDAASDPTVELLYGEGATVNGTWSPEIHYFSEEDFPGASGWYMFLALRRTPEAGSVYTSEYLRLVVLKSITGEPEGPYGHPKTGVANHSQPVITAEGNYYEEWACGQSVLRIPEGKYAGIYALWVDEVGRGTDNFYQRIRISRMANPWTLTGKAGIVTVPTQDWEFVGSEDGFHPAVVEGGTAVYGKNGDIYLTYSGSGYQSAYGLGQLTWNGGDPLETSSWIKYENNPIFSSATAENLIGAGHASFLTDESGNGFFCYHAYPAENGEKTEGRHSYLERYSIDYTAENGVGKGVLRLGSGVPANFETSITFDTDGEALTAPTVYALGRTFSITLNMPDSNAEGFILYRSEDGKVFDYLTTTEKTQYTDLDVAAGKTYYYRVYPCRAEEIGAASAVASCTTTTLSPYTESATANGYTITVTVHAQDNYETVRLYRSEDGTHFGTGIQEINTVQYGETLTFTDTVFGNGVYSYMATGINGGFEYFPAGTVSVEVKLAAPTFGNCGKSCGKIRLTFTADTAFDSYNLYRSTDGETYTKVATGISSPYMDTGLETGTTYFYKVSGVLNDAEGPLSDAVSQTPAHIQTMKSALAPTCTEAGHEKYAICSVCKTVLGEIVSIPALGHSYALTEEEIPATTEAEGKTAVYTCVACGETSGGEVIPKLEKPLHPGSGDANGDGKVNLFDILRILNYIQDSADFPADADKSGDGKLTVLDALLTLQAYLNGEV